MASRDDKIRYIGLSEVSSTTLQHAYKIAPVAAVQVEYSPFERDTENAAGTDLLKICRKLGVSVVCYSRLGRGLPTGTFNAKESVSGANDLHGTYFPRFSQENIEMIAKLVERFKTFADKTGCATSQLAIAWLLKQGDDIIPIPRTKNIECLEENWGSLRIDLADDSETEIRKFVESVEMSGYRSTPSAKAPAFADTKEELWVEVDTSSAEIPPHCAG